MLITPSKIFRRYRVQRQENTSRKSVQGTNSPVLFKAQRKKNLLRFRFWSFAGTHVHQLFCSSRQMLIYKLFATFCRGKCRQSCRDLPKLILLSRSKSAPATLNEEEPLWRRKRRPVFDYFPSTNVWLFEQDGRSHGSSIADAMPVADDLNWFPREHVYWTHMSMLRGKCQNSYSPSWSYAKCRQKIAITLLIPEISLLFLLPFSINNTL